MAAESRQRVDVAVKVARRSAHVRNILRVATEYQSSRNSGDLQSKIFEYFLKLIRQDKERRLLDPLASGRSPGFRIATVVRRLYLCVSNGPMNCQRPRGPHPEPTRSTTAASQGHQFPLAQLPCPPILVPAPTSKAAIGRALARHCQHFRQSLSSPPTPAPSL